MAFEYNAPGAGGRPTCWGDNRLFNPRTRECSSCLYINSCRDDILRAQNQQQRFSSSYPSYQVPPPVGTQQQPVHIGPPQQQPTQQTALMRQPPTQPVVQAYPAPQRYQYGWLTDPMYYAMQASPPPMRPQLEGETFFVRMAKNMVLDASASAAANIYWAIRQAVLAPRPPEPVEGYPFDPNDPNRK